MCVCVCGGGGWWCVEGGAAVAGADNREETSATRHARANNTELPELIRHTYICDIHISSCLPYRTPVNSAQGWPPLVLPT